MSSRTIVKSYSRKTHVSIHNDQRERRKFSIAREELQDLFIMTDYGVGSRSCIFQGIAIRGIS